MKATLHVPLLAATQMAREIELEQMAAEEGASRYERMSQQAVERGEGRSCSLRNACVPHGLSR